MGRHARVQRRGVQALSLGPISIELEWQAEPEEDVLARLLLELIGEDGLKEIIDEKEVAS